MLDLVIFSKNRACQLESLLRSIKDNMLTDINSINIIYTYSNVRFHSGYEKVISSNINKNTNWLKEDSINTMKMHLIDAVEKAEGHVMFLVDDDTVYKPCQIDCNIITSQHAFLSTRLSASHNYKEPTPKFVEKGNYLEWEWHLYGVDNSWGYCFSVDGNVHNKSQIIELLKDVPYNGPNTLEGNVEKVMFNRFSDYPLGLCLKDACVFNNPLNIVRSEVSGTWAGKEYSSGVLNDMFLDGKTINNDKLYRATPDQYHFLIEDII